MAEDSVRQQAMGLRARVGAGTHTASKLWSRGGRGLRAFSRFPYIPFHGGNVVKTTVGRLLTGVFALALLLGGFGLMQNSAQAQAASITAASYLCSVATATDAATSTCTATTTVTLNNAGGATDVEVKNLDVAEVSGSNPRTIQSGATITMVQQFSDPIGDGEIRAFNGNRVQLTFRPDTGFAVIKTITIDNVNPILVTTSPTIPLVVKGGVDITFSADITDGGAGYTGSVGTAADGGGIEHLTDQSGALAVGTNDETDVGGVRLVVAGNVVGLSKDNFEAIDDGWRVSRTLGSSAIQNIGANVPWYFETRDRAGNLRRSSGSIAMKGTVVTGASGTGGITDTRFIGSLPATSFAGTMMKVTRGSASKTVGIATFTNTSGNFTLTLTAENFFADDTTTTTVDESEILEGDKFELVGSNLLTIDSKAPRLESGGVTTGIAYSSSKKEAVRGLSAKANSMQVKFDDDGKYGTERAEADGGPDNAGSGLDAASVTPAAFTVSNNTVNSVLVVGDDVYLTLANNLAPDEQPSVSIASGLIMDKAGNAFGGTRVGKANDGLGPNLALAEDADLSKEKVTITITTDEQLSALPTVMLSRVINNDGDVVVNGTQECVYAAVAGDPAGTPPTADLPELTVAPGGANGDSCAIADTEVNARYTAPSGPTDVAGQPAGAPNPSQTEALAYSYAVTATVANPVDETGGKYNVYVTGVDTQNPTENISKVGHASDANHSAAFTFQLDTALNGGVDPIVTVSDATAASGDADVPDVETISPMIITVDWAGEAGEYPGDSYRTVEMTEAKLTISFSDGSSESRTFDLTTEVSTQDSRKYTIPVLNPKVGAYTLAVKGKDSAGNETAATASHDSKWNVVAAKPVSIDLKPGWNLISLPFQPANPAINSVIPTDHPVGLVMTFDGAEGVWLFSRRDAETGLFTGDVSVITAASAYFVNTDSFKALSLFRPPSATAAAAPAQPPAISVSTGWNLVPVSSNQTPVPSSIDADTYFGTLGDTWLRALSWDPLARTWIAVSPGSNAAGMDPIGEGETGTDRCGMSHDGPSDDGDADTSLTTTVGARVCTGEGMWLWVTKDGTLIPG